VTVDTIARKLRIGHSAVQEMIESLGYRNIWARWVPRLLTEDHKVPFIFVEAAWFQGLREVRCSLRESHMWSPRITPEAILIYLINTSNSNFL
jgi:hypothetical protein